MKPKQIHAVIVEEPPVKASNPKQAFADTKTPVAIVSGAMELWDCLGFLEGMLKYGRMNWRVAGVRVSTYLDAARRHLLKFAEGEWCAEDTQVPHLVSVRACVGIILDAFTASRYPVTSMPKLLGGKFLTDDRTPSVDVSAVERETARVSNHLRELFKDRTPRHFTAHDTHVAKTCAGTNCNSTGWDHSAECRAEYAVASGEVTNNAGAVPSYLPDAPKLVPKPKRLRRKIPVGQANLDISRLKFGKQCRRDFNQFERRLVSHGRSVEAKARWSKRVYGV